MRPSIYDVPVNFRASPALVEAIGDFACHVVSGKLQPLAA